MLLSRLRRTLWPIPRCRCCVNTPGRDTYRCSSNSEKRYLAEHSGSRRPNECDRSRLREGLSVHLGKGTPGSPRRGVTCKTFGPRILISACTPLAFFACRRAPSTCTSPRPPAGALKAPRRVPNPSGFHRQPDAASQSCYRPTRRLCARLARIACPLVPSKESRHRTRTGPGKLLHYSGARCMPPSESQAERSGLPTKSRAQTKGNTK